MATHLYVCYFILWDLLYNWTNIIQQTLQAMSYDLLPSIRKFSHIRVTKLAVKQTEFYKLRIIRLPYLI